MEIDEWPKGEIALAVKFIDLDARYKPPSK